MVPLGEHEECLHDRHAHLPAPDAPDQLLVQLDALELEIHQPHEIGFALAEIIHDQVELLILQPVCGLQEFSVIRRLSEFRHLQPDLPMLETVPVQAAADLLPDSLHHAGLRRQVHVDPRDAVFRKPREPPAALPDHPQVDVMHPAAFLCLLHKALRVEETSLPVPCTEQRLKPGDPVLFHVVDGLEISFHPKTGNIFPSISSCNAHGLLPLTCFFVPSPSPRCPDDLSFYLFPSCRTEHPAV